MPGGRNDVLQQQTAENQSPSGNSGVPRGRSGQRIDIAPLFFHQPVRQRTRDSKLLTLVSSWPRVWCLFGCQLFSLFFQFQEPRTECCSSRGCSTAEETGRPSKRRIVCTCVLCNFRCQFRHASVSVCLAPRVTLAPRNLHYLWSSCLRRCSFPSGRMLTFAVLIFSLLSCGLTLRRHLYPPANLIRDGVGYGHTW